ncbi:PSP1-domain-containing protein [Bimuria novae-zelandiae CBS 107.79]|uniref:PSP1-domain-containing protein n=1 Tax=Bimuria novae-zelandiae CBS 107.79 TaxID=1447943 RepID=A0A6A5V3G5_9PLEO|nr:PSP1-domain-containing protein [Bimuria novae-zelandiae CBS 107.79]
MSGNPFKTSLTVGGSPFDKTKLQMRRPTPDSDVLASSDDDHEQVAPPPTRPAPAPFPTGRRPSWMAQDLPNRKNSFGMVSSVGTPPSLVLDGPPRATTVWNTGSFTASPSTNRLKESVPSPTTAQAPSDNPFGATSPAENDSSVNLVFGQHTTRKSVRSQSYSVGQGDHDTQTSRLRSALRHRPSKPSLLGESAGSLGQLREDDNDEVDSSNGSQHGVLLPPEYQQDTPGKKNKSVTIIAPPPRRFSHSLRSMSHIESDDGSDTMGERRAMPLLRRFSEHVGSTVPRSGDLATNVLESAPAYGVSAPRFNADPLNRRHSIAYGGNMPSFAYPTLDNTKEEDEEASPLEPSLPVLPAAQQDINWNTGDYFSGFGPAARTINASAISAAHPAPTMTHPPPPNAYANPTGYARVGRRIYVVQFKCSRSEIYYLYENTGLEIRVGDLVIVEGDRGHDLGQVTHADVSMDEARRFKNEANEEHFRWLLMFSQYSVAGSSAKNPMLGALYRAHEVPKTGNQPQLSGMGIQQDAENKPRMIRRLAQTHEIMQLRDKEGEEARAKRMATDKANDHNLPMEILDAEFQWDHHKISFFYYAEAYVDFKVLVTDLFKHYKIRIWMSAVNPASVVNPAGMQIKPPSAIGPGAILPNNASNASLSVGPLYGNNSYRSNANDHYGNRGHSTNPQGAYDNTYYPFSDQIPSYAAQNQYPMPQQWGQQYAPAGREVYNRYDSNHPMNRSPMNMGAWYPPTSYSASPAFNAASSSSAFRGGFPAPIAANPYAPSSGQGGYHGSGYTGSAPFVGYDPDMVAAMASLNMGGNSGIDKGASSQ